MVFAELVGSKGNIIRFFLVAGAILGAVMSYSEANTENWSAAKLRFSKFAFNVAPWLILLGSSIYAYTHR